MGTRGPARGVGDGAPQGAEKRAISEKRPQLIDASCHRAEQSVGRARYLESSEAPKSPVRSAYDAAVSPCRPNRNLHPPETCLQ